MRQAPVLVFAVLANTSLGACSLAADHPPYLNDTAPLTRVSRGAVSSDSGSAPPPGMLAVTDGGVCASVMPTMLVTQQQVASPTPQSTGGVVTAGTYVLTQMNKYTGTGGATGPTTKIAAEVYRVDSSTYQHAKADAEPDGGGLSPVALDSGNYSATGTTFTVMATCGIGNIPVSYTATSTGLKLAFLNEEYVFTLQ
jgi:hypothetical protein